MKGRICIIQDDLKDCGITSLLMIIRYYRGNIPKEYLRSMTKTTKDGVSAFYLIKTAQELGFSTKALKGNIELLENNDFPLIAHIIVNDVLQHFVVVYEVKNNKVIIADPSYGIRKIPMQEWQKVSTNKYLLFKPVKKIPNLTNDKTIISIIGKFFCQYRAFWIIIFLLSLVYIILNIVTSYNFKILMDNSTINNSNSLKSIFIVLISFGIIKNLIDLLRGKIINYLNYNLDKILVNDAYRHIISLPYLYYKTRTTGDVITRINDISNIKDLISKVFITIFIDLIVLLVIIFVLFSINKLLTIVSLCVSLLYIIIMLIYNKFIYKYVKEGYEKSSIVNTYLVESINAIDTIKGLNMENIACNKLNLKYTGLLRIGVKIGNIICQENFLKESVNYIGTLLIMYLGIGLIIQNKMEITTLITYIGLLSYYLEPIKNIVDLNYTYKQSILSFKRIIEMYQVKSEVFKITEKTKSEQLEGNIKINNLSYSYNGIDNVLKNINLTINAKEKILLCGGSGKGKSTLVKLLVKYLNDYKGSIYIDNRNLDYYELSDIRSKICYISQNEVLFSDTLYNNITLNRNVNYDKVLEICNLMYVHEITDNMPFKYDTLIEENGFNLSGGERQRIVLARSLLKEADIYIFDEALNAIDVNKEKIILKNIFNLLSNKTIIVISHRFNNADLFSRKINIGDFNEC